MNLLDWAEDYFRHRDLILCQIETIVKNKDNLIIRHNDGIVKKIYITDYINNFDFSLDGDVNNIFVLNNKKNLNFLINHWDELSKHKNLSFYFINPDSSIDKLWIISPYIHSKICEPDNIERSLNSLFSSVCEIK